MEWCQRRTKLQRGARANSDHFKVGMKMEEWIPNKLEVETEIGNDIAEKN